MRRDWSLEEVMNSRYKDYQAVSAEHDANYHTWMMKAELPPLYKFTQDGEFDYPYYRIYTYYCEYVFTAWLIYSPDNNLWGFQAFGDWPISTRELRAIADKLDELNTQLLKERTWLDRLFNMW